MARIGILTFEQEDKDDLEYEDGGADHYDQDIDMDVDDRADEPDNDGELHAPQDISEDQDPLASSTSTSAGADDQATAQPQGQSPSPGLPTSAPASPSISTFPAALASAVESTESKAREMVSVDVDMDDVSRTDKLEVPVTLVPGAEVASVQAGAVDVKVKPAADGSALAASEGSKQTGDAESTDMS